MEILNDFKIAVAEAGFQIDQPIADGQIQRFDIDKPGDKAGWYVLFDGDFSTGIAESWKSGERIKWTSKNPQMMTKTEKAKYFQKLELAKKLSEQELKKRHAEAKIKALAIWKKAKPAAGNHPYLKAKMVMSLGLSVHDGNLIVPAVDENGELWTVQTIRPDGTKRFLTGGRKRGCYFKIPGNNTLCIAEGYATGATIHQATGATVFICLDAGNLKPVAISVRKKNPNAEIIICADNDQWTYENPGISKARGAAMEISARVIFPEFKNVESKPTDFNDLHVTEGLDVVKAQLESNADLSIENVREDPEPDEWKVARELFPRLPFPWKVLPAEIATSLRQLARSHATSPLSLPGAAIAIFSSALGATVNVSPKKNWNEPLIVWCADIRPSGSGKTPAARALCRVLYNSQSQADVERKRQIDEEMGKRPKDRQEVARSRSYFITDLTLEGLRTDFTGHGGSICIMDELSSFISGQNQYKKKGNDREAWLTIHDGNPARIVRAKESITISGARISLFGGIQPTVWQTCFSGEKGLFLEDGTVYRFLSTFEGDTLYKLTPESWSDENRGAWERTLTLAMEWADQAILHEDWKSKSLCLSEDAQAYFLDWRNDIYSKKTELPDQLKGFLPKITSYALRLSGVLYCMDRFAVGSFPGAILTENDIHKGISAATFYLGHIVDAMQALCSKDRIIPFEMTDQVKHLAATLESLKSELDNGRLAVGFICERFNQMCAEDNTSVRMMGSLLRNNGLTIPAKRYRANGKVGAYCLVWDKKTKNFLKRVHKVQQVHKVNDSKASDLLNVENVSSTCSTKQDSLLNVLNIEKRKFNNFNPHEHAVCEHVEGRERLLEQKNKKFTMEI